MTPGQPGSRDDLQFCRDITSIARSMDRIANYLEAAENRARAQELITPEEIEQLAPAIAAVRRGMADLEEAVRKEREEGRDAGSG